MADSELISDEIYKELFSHYINEQVDELNNSDIEELNAVYVRMFDFYRSSSPEDKENIIDYIKEIISDTASIILGGIDNVEPLGELSGRFELKYDGEIVNSDLQENFLSNIQTEDDNSDKPIY